MNLPLGVLGDVVLVRHHEDGLPLPVEVHEDRHDLLAGGGVQVARGLVGQQDGGLVDERARDRHALPLAAGELRWAVVHAQSQAHRLQRLAGPLAPLAGGHAGIDERKLHVVQRRGARQQVEGLEHEPDFAVADVGELIVAQVAHQLLVQPVLPPGGGVQAPDQVHEGGFAAARGSHDGDKLAPADLEFDAAKGADGLRSQHVVLGQSYGLNDRSAHSSLPRIASSCARATA